MTGGGLLRARGYCFPAARCASSRSRYGWPTGGQLPRSRDSSAVSSALADTGPGGTYARLGDLGHAPARFREDLRARMPAPEETERLELAAGTPVVDIIRVAADADGRRSKSTR